MNMRWRIPLFFIAIIFASCAKKEPEPQSNQSNISSRPQSAPPVDTYEIVNTYPHDPTAFTEGLQFYNGELYESTGLEGYSTLRRVELATGKVLQKVDLDPKYFGEGIVIFDSKIYQLTYTTEIGFIYDLKTFKQTSTWNYQGQGWSLTSDGTSLIMSNGTERLKFLDPNNLSVVKTIDVQESGMPIENVNELEYIKGEIWANIWRTDRIVRIDPATGNVKGWIDLSELLPPDEMKNVDVLNGIAYDAEHDRIFITGKNWPKLFEIKIKPSAQHPQ
ncbi:MAG TPA: glutaminyl-peptide cyclotransferase [Candidatus Kapabacteria bacterium]|nr:glutaminyl-peptide cyclotransferase [Candidatus Kapabacteria bacterium]